MVRYPFNVGLPPTTDGDSDWQVMNEIALHRGSSPHLNTIDIFVDGQHLTEAVVCTFGLQMCFKLIKLVISLMALSFPLRPVRLHILFRREVQLCIHL